MASEKEFLDVMSAIGRIIIDPTTGNFYPGAVGGGGGYWIPITDDKIETYEESHVMFGHML